MSWLRYSDDYTQDRVWENVGYEARWHFKALIEACSQSRRWDGALSRRLAERASDVPDPAECLRELHAAGLICVTDGVTDHASGTQGHAPDCVTDHAPGIAIPTIEDHIPSESNRDENRLPRKRANTAAWRARKCAAGAHSKDCPPDTCELKLAKKAARAAKAGNGGVSDSVTAHAGTGRDGTGPTTLTPSKSESRPKPANDVGRGVSQFDEKPADREEWPETRRPPDYGFLREIAAEKGRQ